MLIDTHCHLDFDDFTPELDAVVERALAAGVERMITISTRVKEFDRLLAIAEKYQQVFCSVGTHPCNAKDETDIRVDDLIALTQHPKVVAIGEAGLDYHYEKISAACQKLSFSIHIEAARQTKLPLIIHARSADEDMMDFLQTETKKGSFPFILHCYSSGLELAKAGLELGGFISFSGIITFKNAAKLREIAQIVPLERILVETDAPYLAPVPFRGQRNEPSFVRETANFLADFLNIEKRDFALITSNNALKIFSKMEG